jgi:transcription-repair coupling factor (superfamily II helicase)
LSDRIFTPFDHAVQFLADSTEGEGVYGLRGSAGAFLVAAAAARGTRTIAMILPDGEIASSAAADTRFFLGAERFADNPLRDEVLLYPSSDAIPYSFAGFENDVSVGRMAVLGRLAEAAPPKVLVVGLDALIRRVTPKAAVRRTSLCLRVGDELDRDLFLELLVSGGYNRAPLVEDTGDFSVRGFIIDLYPPLYPSPVRIEQIGDEIESIRFFDPSSQRSRDEVNEIHVGPVHMLIPDDESRERGLSLLLQRCEDRGTEKRVRRRLLEDFRNRVRFPGAASYLPYFVPGLECLTDYLPPDSTIILPDAFTLDRAFEDAEEEIFRGWESAAEEGLPVPDPAELYLPKEELLRGIANFRTVVMSPADVEEPGPASYEIKVSPNDDIRPDLLKSRSYDSGMAGLVKRLEQWRDDGNEVLLVSHTRGQANRLLRLLEPYDLSVDFRGEGFESSNLGFDPTPGVRLYVGELSCGFRMEHARWIVITEEEIFGSRVRTSPKRRARGTSISSLTDLAEGEPIVHEDYGIGIFRGLATKEFEGVPGEVMVIEYAGGDLLYHPLDRLECVQKYVSGSDGPYRIDRLGGKAWAKTKAKVTKSIREMAAELLKIYAKREVATRPPYSPPDENLAAFEAAFEFEETPDQAAAIRDLMEALDSDKPMDRLVCGDVGFGKTEVALRAAFRVLMDGKQVAVLVPTTVLAQQHYDTVVRRLNGYPFEVEVLSRFRSSTEQKEIIGRLEKGTLDLVVGTHRLLQKDVKFRDLGLIVVDEEHRFGVAHKERIKKYKARIDVLTLTATPIPRTLHMSLTGIRDLSLIETPPVNRKSIRTRVLKQSDDVIRDALLREINRGGQVFYLHNRVSTIFRRTAALKRLVPEGRFETAHGRMSSRELERVMFDFVRGRFNVLVCTSIIESGLDIPRANTIIIERADTFGLADLYQLRGRVGRSNLRAYAYLLTPPEALMTTDAVKRLAVIREHSDLGQGFRIAMRDMEIRGAGNILGSSQSGHVALVGYEMYLNLLEQAVKEIKGETPPPKIDPEIRLKLESMIPKDYVPDPRQRMNLYKRLSRARDRAGIEEIEEEMLDLYGKAPAQVSNLLRIMRIRQRMKPLGIAKLEYNEEHLVLAFDSATPVKPEALVAWAHEDPAGLRLLPGDRLLYRIGDVDEEARFAQAFDLLERLEKIAPS